MSGVFFTSDTHFGHELLTRGGHRPFESIEDHDRCLIDNWNDVVERGDRVYHLGDVSFHPTLRTREILESLNGLIFLVRGNHDDRLSAKVLERFEWVKDAHYLRFGEYKIYLSHYAHRVWRARHHGSFHLYGHSHGSLPDDESRSTDVGVDRWDWRPVSFFGVVQKLSGRSIKAIDHHVGVEE